MLSRLRTSFDGLDRALRQSAGEAFAAFRADVSERPYVLQEKPTAASTVRWRRSGVRLDDDRPLREPAAGELLGVDRVAAALAARGEDLEQRRFVHDP